LARGAEPARSTGCLERANRHHPRRSQAGKRGNGYRRCERPYGKFSRAIQLPTDSDIDRAAAKFNQGVMTLSIPQAGAAKTRQISVQAA
jgi:HSP20 family protein